MGGSKGDLNIKVERPTLMSECAPGNTKVFHHISTHESRSDGTVCDYYIERSPSEGILPYEIMDCRNGDFRFIEVTHGRSEIAYAQDPRWSRLTQSYFFEIAECAKIDNGIKAFNGDRVELEPVQFSHQVWEQMRDLMIRAGLTEFISNLPEPEESKIFLGVDSHSIIP